MGAEYAILGTGIGGDRRAEVMVALFLHMDTTTSIKTRHNVTEILKYVLWACSGEASTINRDPSL